MSSDAPESAQYAASLLLYIAILLMLARVIAWDTEWREVNRKLAEAVLLDCARFIFVIIVLTLIIRFFFSTLDSVLASVKGGGNTMYVLMVFIVLLSKISSNTGLSSDSDEYRLLYRWRWVLGRHGLASGEHYLIWAMVALWSLLLCLKWRGNGCV